MSAVVLFVAGTAWGFTSYINDTIGRVNAGTAGTPASGPLNVLLAGVDQRSGLTRHQELALHVGNDVSSNSDTLMLIHVSGDRSRVTVISIPRDSWVNIPGHGLNKINAAYGLGGPKLVVQTVEANTGLTINDFVQVNFLGFVKVIDALGGVNICLPFAVDDPYSGLHLSQGLHHVSGITALEYARDRHSFATSDLARIQDQQRLLSSMLTEAISSGTLANPVKLDRFLHAALAAIKVDQGLNVAALADQMRGVSPSDVRFMTVPLSNYNYQTPSGELAVLWNAEESRALFNELKHDQPATKPPARHARAGRPEAAAQPGARRGVERNADRRPVRQHRRRPVPAGLPGEVRADLAGPQRQPDRDPVPARGRGRGPAGPEGHAGCRTAAGEGAGQGTGPAGRERLLGDHRDGHAQPLRHLDRRPLRHRGPGRLPLGPLTSGWRAPRRMSPRRACPGRRRHRATRPRRRGAGGRRPGGFALGCEPPEGVLPSGSPSPWDASCRDSASTSRSILPWLSGVPRPVRSAYTVAPRSRNIASARRLAWAWSSLTLPSRAVSCAIWASCVLCALTLSISPMTASAEIPAG